MVSNIALIYDDTTEPSYDVANVIGEKSYGSVVYKRVSLKERFLKLIQTSPFIESVYEMENLYQMKRVMTFLSELENSTSVLHFFSHFIVTDTEKFQILIEKLRFLKEPTIIKMDDKVVAVFFCEKETAENFLKNCSTAKDTQLEANELKYHVLEADCFRGIDTLDFFLQFITSGFDARFFNSLKGDEYTVVKSSSNKKKIKMEYQYYYFLPEDMKSWFVQPYNYQENETEASYTMERLHMTDLAIRYVHGAIGMDEFQRLMDKVFYFIKVRKSRQTNQKEYLEKADQLYVKKVEERIAQLESHPLYETLACYIKQGTKYQDIREIVQKYMNLYEKVRARIPDHYMEVIGHGDLCFSNMLYNKDTRMLKLIDTKGALTEEELWTNPYYDLAKLSHSICGRYDFFNSGLYEITMDENLQFGLQILFDQGMYEQIFKSYLKTHDFDYYTVRVLEASLFLSMLPLHMDYPQKVFAFLLNAIKILEEIEHGKS